jgi:hypothetical protein
MPGSGCRKAGGEPPSQTERPPLTETVVDLPASATPPDPEPLPGGEPEPAASVCARPIHGLLNAFAIPQGRTGTVELVLSDRTMDCHYWTDDFQDRCDIWRARISVAAKNQKPGTYALADDFAYLDRRVAVQGHGAKAAGFTCNSGGGRLAGTLEITSVDQRGIRGSICSSRVDGTNHADDSLIDGTFVATRCPACAMTGDPCSSNQDCCAGNCGSGRCHP